MISTRCRKCGIKHDFEAKPSDWHCTNCGAYHKRYDIRRRSWAGDARKAA